MQVVDDYKKSDIEVYLACCSGLAGLQSIFCLKSSVLACVLVLRLFLFNLFARVKLLRHINEKPLKFPVDKNNFDNMTFLSSCLACNANVAISKNFVSEFAVSRHIH